MRADDIADEGYGTHRPGERLFTQRDFDLIAGGVRLCVDQIVVFSRQYQHATIRAGVLERDRHQPLDQLRQHDLAGHGLGGFDDARDVELMDRGANARRGIVSLRSGKMRMKSIELPYLGVGAPAEIAGPRVAKIDVRDGLETAHRIEASGEFVTDAFVLDETMLARRMNGRFVEPLGAQLVTLQTRYLGADQRRAGLEVCWAALRPDQNLPVVIEQRLQVAGPAVGRRGITGSRVDESGVEMIFGELKRSP